jgi:biopolymer transport protein ExbD
MNAHYASMLEADLGAKMLKSVRAEKKPEPVFRGKGSNRKYITDGKLEARREMVTDALKSLGKATPNELSVELKSDKNETYNDLIRLCNDGVVERKKSRLERGHMRYVYWVADCNDGST